MVHVPFRPAKVIKFDPAPGNRATPLVRPNFYDPLVTVLTGFHCTDFCLEFVLGRKFRISN